MVPSYSSINSGVSVTNGDFFFLFRPLLHFLGTEAGVLPMEIGFVVLDSPLHICDLFLFIST